MRASIRVALLLAGALGLRAARPPDAFAASAELVIVRDGKAAGTLVVPDKPTHWEQVAAGWVREYVKKSSGAELGLVAEAQAPPGTLVSVGHTDLADKAGIRTDDLKYDGCKLIAKGNVLFLIGRDTPGVTPTSRGREAGARGTLRAATKFIEDFVGVRWFVPAAAGEVVPKTRDIAVPGDLNVSFSPAFGFAHGRDLYGEGPASIANNFRTATLVKTYGDDSHSQWVPKAKYAKDHPEYFIQTESGKRDPGGNHLCTSNPEVRKLLKKGLFEQFEKGYELVQLGQTDGYEPCRCPKCEVMGSYPKGLAQYLSLGPKRLLGDYLRFIGRYPAERLHVTHKWLIDEAGKKYPDRKVHLLVYAPTRTPSKRFDHYGDNVVAEICGGDLSPIIDLWESKVSAFSVYVYWFDVSLGYGIDAGIAPVWAAERVRELHRRGCIGIYFGGGGENWGYMGPTYYVLGKMMGDPGLDYKGLVNDYCRGLYGKAAGEMEAFFDLLYTRLDTPRVAGTPFTEMQVARYTPEFATALRAHLDKAAAIADGRRERNFIQMSCDQFDYNALLADVLRAYRLQDHCKGELAADNWGRVAAAVRKFDEFRDKVARHEDGFVKRYYPGYDKFCNYLTGGNYYDSWERRRAKLLSNPIGGCHVGQGQAVVDAPLTLDLSKPPGAK